MNGAIYGAKNSAKNSAIYGAKNYTMKIALCNQKGGSGKTTATLLLSYAMASAGSSVGIIDHDPQKTATYWLDSAPMDGLEIAKKGKAYDVVFMDTPGILNHPSLKKSVKDADKVILVSSTSPADLWSTQAAIDFVKGLRSDITPRLLFTRYARNTEYGKAKEEFAAALGISPLKNAIPERTSIQRAAVKGWKALSSADREIIQSIAIEILSNA